MAITSPNNLWRDYDVGALPLNESALSDKTENGIRVREFYFDGFATVDGRVRAYIKLYENADANGVILYLGDGQNDEKAIFELYENGYSVAALDYLGESEISPRFTLYPQSLAACNCRGKSEFIAPDDALSSCWFVWTCIARKAVILLKKYCAELNIFALGKGLGGSTVYKLAAVDDNIKACATVLNILPNIVGEGDSMILYRAALAAVAYAPLTKLPLFLAVASNDENGSFDRMNELAGSTASLKRYRIVERAFSPGITPAYKEVLGFFDCCAKETEALPRPSIKAANSDNHLYYNISLNTSPDADEYADKAVNVELFTSFFIENPAHRNWTKSKLLGLGDGEFMARIDVLRNEKPVYAFVNVTYESGAIQSSQLLSVIPKMLGIPSQPTTWHRLIYDGSMGKDVWTSPSGGNVIKTRGLFDIEGITSDSNSLATFKTGDPLYRAPNGTLLQLLVSGKAHTINITLLDEDDYYTCKAELPSSDAWHKLTLSTLDFKGASGPLPDWSHIIMIEFTADDEFIISSLLWV